MEISFTRPQYLFFLLSVPLLIITHFFTMVYLKRRAFKFANLEAIKRVTGGDTASFRNTIFLSRNVGLLVIRTLVLLLLIFSASGTVLWLDRLTGNFDAVIVIDSSASMLASDISPSRLEGAKTAASDFVSKLGSSTSVGVVSFSGSSYVDQPMTPTLSNVQTAIENIRVRQVGGTDIGSAMIAGTNLVLSQSAGSDTLDKGRVMVLITDGQSNVGTPISEGIEYTKQNQMQVFTVGIGTEQGGSFLQTGSSTSIDEESLKEIAQKTNGKYFRASSTQDLIDTFNEILSSSNQRTPISLSQALLIVAILFLFLEWGLISTKYRSVP